MKTGKITAKLRDAVIIRLFEDGKERKQYKNIELPDALKELEVKDFEFDVPMDGKITFKIHYAPGILPQVFPAPRAKMTRAAKAAAKATSAAPSIVTSALAKDTKPTAPAAKPETMKPDAKDAKPEAAKVAIPTTTTAMKDSKPAATTKGASKDTKPAAPAAKSATTPATTSVLANAAITTKEAAKK